MPTYCRPIVGWNGTLPTMYSGHIPAGSDVQDGKTYEVFMWYMFVPVRYAGFLRTLQRL